MKMAKHQYVGKKRGKKVRLPAYELMEDGNYHETKLPQTLSNNFFPQRAQNAEEFLDQKKLCPSPPTALIYPDDSRENEQRQLEREIVKVNNVQGKN